jgi:hypothetical protein
LTCPNLSGTLAVVNAAQTFSSLQSFTAGITANNLYVTNGATFASNISAPNVVYSFNGSTGAVTYYPPLATSSVTGVASFGNQFVVSALGAVSLTANYVSSVNGSTGAVTSIAVTGANTFTGLQTMTAGITASTLYVSSGATFASRSSFTAGITASALYVSGGATFAGLTVIGDIEGANNSSYIVVNDSTPEIKVNNPLGVITIGDVDAAYNGTAVIVDDASTQISLNGYVAGNGSCQFAGNATVSGAISFGAAGAAIESQTTALTTTASNQIIWSYGLGDGLDPGYVPSHRSAELTIQATRGTSYELVKMLVVHTDSYTALGDTYNTEYGVVRNGSALASYTTTLATAGGGSRVLRLRATPSLTGTTFKVSSLLMPS